MTEVSFRVLSGQWEDSLSSSSFHLEGGANLILDSGFSGSLNSRYTIDCPDGQGLFSVQGTLVINQYLGVEGCKVDNAGDITIEEGAQFICLSELTSSGSILMKDETISEFGRLQVEAGSSFTSSGSVRFTDSVVIQSETFSISEISSSGTVTLFSLSDFPENNPIAETLKIQDGQFTLERGESQNNIHISNVLVEGGTFECKHELGVKLLEMKEGYLVLRATMDLERLSFLSGDINGGPSKSTLAVDIIDVSPSASKSLTSVDILVRTTMNWNTNPFSDVISMSGNSKLTVNTGATMTLLGSRFFKSTGSSGMINNKGTITHVHSELPEDSVEIECDLFNEGSLSLNLADTVTFSGSLQSTSALNLHPQGTFYYGSRSIRDPVNIVSNIIRLKQTRS